MKTIAAILLLSVYTFNLVGYHLLFHAFRQAAADQLQRDLDNDCYQDSDLTTLIIPLSLPYINDSPAFERLDGEVEKDGKIYRFVKRAVRNGALVLLCVPDRQRMQLEEAKLGFAKQANDFLPTPAKKSRQAGDDLLKMLKVKYKPAEYKFINLLLPTTIKTYSDLCLEPVNRESLLPDEPPEVSST